MARRGRLMHPLVWRKLPPNHKGLWIWSGATGHPSMKRVIEANGENFAGLERGFYTYHGETLVRVDSFQACRWFGPLPDTPVIPEEEYNPVVLEPSEAG